VDIIYACLDQKMIDRRLLQGDAKNKNGGRYIVWAPV